MITTTATTTITTATIEAKPATATACDSDFTSAGKRADTSSLQEGLESPTCPLSSSAPPPSSSESPHNLASLAPLNPSAPQIVVTVRQYQQVRPYAGQTSWKTFREHLERVVKVTQWISDADKIQNLSLSLEGAALDVLKEVDETASTAYADIWHALSRRFGHIDDKRDAMRRFDLRKQGDSETLVELEQALRTLYHEAWPESDSTQRNQTLKSRFKECLISVEMTQYLRLHTLDDNFEETVQKGRRLAAATEVKPIKSVRIVTEAPEATDPIGDALKSLIARLEALEHRPPKPTANGDDKRSGTPVLVLLYLSLYLIFIFRLHIFCLMILHPLVLFYHFSFNLSHLSLVNMHHVFQSFSSHCLFYFY